MRSVRKDWLGCAVGSALALGLGSGVSAHPGCASSCEELAAERERAQEMIEYHVFHTLPERDRAIIAAHEGVPSVADLACDDGVRPSVMGPPHYRELGEGETPSWDEVAELISRDAFERLEPIHQRMLVTFNRSAEAFGVHGIFCFGPGSDPALVEAVSRAIERNATDRFQQIDRWDGTALDPGPANQGDPTILTYSFVPDGTFVPNLIGVTGNSNLFAWLDGIYGNTATWQQLYHDTFDRWGDLCGNTYIWEPNDDGSNLNTLPGEDGVRGDLRLAAIPIDGNSGVLAYNNFPQDGDMVLDSADGFYAQQAGGSNLAIRNIISHEHGHGMGQLHVCPIEETKLMEPFISLAFDGPQIDDILNAQRHYGDANEPNDSISNPTDLGAINNTIRFEDRQSIDGASDVDFFRFSVDQARDVVVTVNPLGFTYLEGPQTQACNTGSPFDALGNNDLNAQLLTGDGVAILADVDATGPGSAETISFTLPGAGDYIVRVGVGSVDAIQAYRVDVETSNPAGPVPLSIFPTVEVPEVADAGQTVPFGVRVFEGTDSLVPGSVVLRFRDDGGAFTDIAPIAQSGNDFDFEIPASFCDEAPEFFVSADGSQGSATLPAGAPAQTFVYDLTSGSEVAFADDFQTQSNWTVSGNAGDGQWEVGVPVNNGRGDPPADFDGSGACFLTDNGLDNGDNSDVDDGSTTFTINTPFDLSDGGTISYAYWVDSGPGVIDGDFLRVEIATDSAGTNWQTVREYTTPQFAWRTDSIDIASELGTTSATVWIRFTAADLGSPSLIEAAVDALDVEANVCTLTPVDCFGDADGNGVVDVNDLTEVVNFLGTMDPDADVDGNGVVDVNDITEVVNALGTVCD